MMARITSTIKYDRFDLLKANRDKTPRHVRDLQKAIAELNLLQWYPIVCTPNGAGPLHVVDGQHRLLAAMNLGVPIYYVVVDKEQAEQITTARIAKTNSLQKKWVPRDYVKSFSADERPAYVMLRDFLKETGLTTSIAILLLTGRLSASDVVSGNCSSAASFHNGDLEITEDGLEFGYQVGDALAIIQNHVPWAKQRNFVAAIARCMAIPEFRVERLIDKIGSRPGKLEKRSEIDQHIEQFENLYNFHARKTDIFPLRIEVQKLFGKS